MKLIKAIQNMPSPLQVYLLRLMQCLLSGLIACCLTNLVFGYCAPSVALAVALYVMVGALFFVLPSLAQRAQYDVSEIADMINSDSKSGDKTC